MMVAASIGALLWENWRLTRIEAAQRLGLGILGGSAALLLIGNGTSVAFWILFALNAFFYMSIAKLNGGKFMDGYKPGFPLYLLYTRPVPTSVFVGVAMAYDAISGVASYLVSAAILGYAFGQPFPLLGAAAVIVVVHLTYICIQWSTQSRVIQWIGSLVIGLPAFFLLKDRAGSPHEINFSFAEYAAMCVICVVSIVLTVAGVARQRRGDAIGTAPRAAKSGVYPVWLVDLFRFSCPTSSATRAQVWFELKSSGLPALAVGLGLGMLIFVLFAISIPVEVTRPFAIVSVVIAAPALLLLLGGNAFGIRRRQGRTYASAFELTQPSRTAQMAGLKVLLRTACLLVALTVVGVSIWASSSLLGSWGSWVVEGGKDAVPEFLKLRQEIGAALAGMMASAYVAQVVITSVAVGVLVAALATFAALRARYPRRLLIVGSMLLFHGLALVLLALAEQEEIASPLVVETVFAATGWTLVVAMVLATIYLGWSGVAERALTIRYAIGASMVSAAFAMAWLTVLHAAGVQFAGMAAAGVVGIMWPVLLPPVAGVFAPWALGRVRHA
jgi:hypothetical protein